jgi:hypothetical protein
VFDFIQGERFQQLVNEHIFYCHTHDFNEYITSLPRDKKIVLITHNSDGAVCENPRLNRPNKDANANLLPDNIIKWYSTNIKVSNPRIESIPIGFENSQWFPETKKLKKIDEIRTKKHKYKNLLYINHNIATNVTERLEPYNLFRKEDWCTLFRGKNGTNFDEYLENMHSHMFVLSPEGNGLDTHRLWEALVIGTIPIEKRNINNSFYSDLPICFVNKWSDITLDFLEKEYIRIKSTNYDLNKLTFSYWKDKINGTIR